MPQRLGPLQVRFIGTVATLCECLLDIGDAPNLEVPSDATREIKEASGKVYGMCDTPYWCEHSEDAVPFIACIIVEGTLTKPQACGSLPANSHPMQLLKKANPEK